MVRCMFSMRVLLRLQALSPAQGRSEERHKSLFYQGGQVGQECVAPEVPHSSKQCFSNVRFGKLGSRSPAHPPTPPKKEKNEAKKSSLTAFERERTSM